MWVFVPSLVYAVDLHTVWIVAMLPDGPITIEKIELGAGVGMAVPEHAHNGASVAASVDEAVRLVEAAAGGRGVWSIDATLRLVGRDCSGIRTVVLQTRGEDWYLLRVDVQVDVGVELVPGAQVPTMAHRHTEAPEGPFTLPAAMARAAVVYQVPFEEIPPCPCPNIGVARGRLIKIGDVDFEEA